MARVPIDAIRNVEVDQETFFNELRTLQYLRAGIFRIVNVIDHREVAWRSSPANQGVKIFSMGIDIDGTDGLLDEIACFFHWFGVSICNYARLVAFVGTLTDPQRSAGRGDLKTKEGRRKIKDAVDEYVEQIAELSAVLKWRNKIGAHFAITDPRKDDNLATLDMSVMFPVSFSDGRYRVNELVMTVTQDSGSAQTSEIPCWSITEVFESLLLRFWPNVRKQPSQVKDEDHENGCHTSEHHSHG